MDGIQCRYPVQPWPTFISAQRRAEIAAATVGVFRLLRTIPQRIFARDYARIAAYYQISPPDLTPYLLSPPNGLASAIGRADFIDSDAGFKCVEFNPYGNLGGLETEFMLPGYRRSAAYAAFVAASGVQPAFKRCGLHLFEHFIKDCRLQRIAGSDVNIACILESEEVYYESNAHLHAPVYAEALRLCGDGLTGQLIACRASELVERDGAIHHGDTRIHGVWELGTVDPCPPHLFLAFKARRIAYFNSPFSGYLGEKRNLALLSEAAETDAYDEDEKAIIHSHVPWTREMADREVTRDGTRQSLPALVVAQRETLVLKKGFGMKGEQVYIGKSCTPQEWASIARTAVTEGDWVAQEYLAPRAYLYQHGDKGHFPYQAVWGTFCFGDTYGGAYLRIVPETKGGPINSAQGAMTGFVFEV